MNKAFVELAKEFADSLTGVPDEAYVWAGRFATHLDAQGIKPKKSRWVKFEATADSVCPVPPDALVKLKLENGYVSSNYQYGIYFTWNSVDVTVGDKIIAYKVKKGQGK